MLQVLCVPNVVQIRKRSSFIRVFFTLMLEGRISFCCIGQVYRHLKMFMLFGCVLRFAILFFSLRFLVLSKVLLFF